MASGCLVENKHVLFKPANRRSGTTTMLAHFAVALTMALKQQPVLIFCNDADDVDHFRDRVRVTTRDTGAFDPSGLRYFPLDELWNMSQIDLPKTRRPIPILLDLNMLNDGTANKVFQQLTNVMENSGLPFVLVGNFAMPKPQ
jgi:hypothetical protein